MQVLVILCCMLASHDNACSCAMIGHGLTAGSQCTYNIISTSLVFAEKAARLHPMQFLVSVLGPCSQLHQYKCWHAAIPWHEVNLLAVCPTLITCAMSQAHGHMCSASPLCEFDIHNVLVHAFSGMYWWRQPLRIT